MNPEQAQKVANYLTRWGHQARVKGHVVQYTAYIHRRMHTVTVIDFFEAKQARELDYDSLTVAPLDIDQRFES